MGAQSVFQTHAPLTIRMHYVAHQPISRPVFGVALHHENGFWINGPNTRFDNVDIPDLAGAGYVDYHIPALPLLAGRYQISAAVVDRTMLHTYDHHNRMYRLVVQSTALNERYGAIAIQAAWDWHTAGRAEAVRE
jgi:lipopolysaccharide transport system ATP-binding protein